MDAKVAVEHPNGDQMTQLFEVRQLHEHILIQRGLELFSFGQNWENVPTNPTHIADLFLAEFLGSYWRIELP